MQDIIKKYQLTAHPEGGYYREIYRSQQELESSVNGERRSALTHIYFLLMAGQLSRFHRVLHDEVWNFYEGDPIRLIRYDGTCVREVEIGPGCRNYTHVFEGGVWQAAEPKGDYSLLGCSVAPGFDFADFSFMNEREGELLAEQYADYKKFI